MLLHRTLHVYGLFHMGRGGVVTGNVVAGVNGMAYSVDGYECGAKPTIDHNVAHSAPMGVWYEMRDEQLGSMATRVYGAPLDFAAADGMTSRSGYGVGPKVRAKCFELSNFKVHSTLLYGAHSGRKLPEPGTFNYKGNRGSLIYTNFTMVDTGIAFSHNSEGPDSTFPQRFGLPITNL